MDIELPTAATEPAATAQHVPMTPEAPADIIEAILVSTPRFCRTCGRAWQPDQADCANCTQNLNRPTKPLSVATELRGMKSAVWLFVTLLAICGIGIAGGKLGGSALDSQLVVTAALSLATLVWCAFSWRTLAPPLRPAVHPKWFGLALLLSTVSFAVAIGAIHGYLRWTHLAGEQMSPAFLQAGYGWGMIVLCVCVQPAVIEELAFRGIVFDGIRAALTPFETVMVSALMFMILHLTPARFPHTLALGLAAGFLRLRSKSLYPCMLLHFSHNLLCVWSEHAGWW